MAESIPLRPVVECRTCGAGAPVDEHFCRQCSRILALGRHGDYFSFFGLPRQLTIDPQDLERRFRELSRKFHPDYYYNAPPAERLASLERSSYLNDAYRALRNPAGRVAHLLALEGLPPVTSGAAGAAEQTTPTVPPALLEEVFELNEELDAIRELRESGTDAAALRARLDAARRPIEARREAHEQQLDTLSRRWDTERDAATAEQRRQILDVLRERLLERNYINNLLATVDREASSLPSSASGHAEMGDRPSESGRG